MAEIKNYTFNFGCGRALRGIDFAEVQRDFWLAC